MIDDHICRLGVFWARFNRWCFALTRMIAVFLVISLLSLCFTLWNDIVPGDLRHLLLLQSMFWTFSYCCFQVIPGDFGQQFLKDKFLLIWNFSFCRTLNSTLISLFNIFDILSSEKQYTISQVHIMAKCFPIYVSRFVAYDRAHTTMFSVYVSKHQRILTVSSFLSKTISWKSLHDIVWKLVACFLDDRDMITTS